MYAIPAAQPSITINFVPHAPAAQHAVQEGERLNLRPYEVVRATVVEGGMDRVELELGRLRFRAWTRIPLRAGQMLHLQVQDTSSQIELRIINQELTQNLMQLLHLFGEKADFTGMIKSVLSGAQEGTASHGLKSLLQGLLQGPEKTDGNLLSSLGRLLGLDLEALLARSDAQNPRESLKAFLLGLLSGSGAQAGQKSAGEHLLNHLELLQLCRAKLYQEGISFLPLPFSFLEQGFALMERRGGPKEKPEREPEVYRINLCLQLQNLGSLEVRLLYEGQGLHVRILCQDEATARFISGFEEELRETLTALPVGGFSVTSGAGDPDKLLIERVLPESERVVERKV